MPDDGDGYLWCYAVWLPGIVELAKDEIDAVGQDNDPGGDEDQRFVLHLDIDNVNNDNTQLKVEQLRALTYLFDSCREYPILGSRYVSGQSWAAVAPRIVHNTVRRIKGSSRYGLKLSTIRTWVPDLLLLRQVYLKTAYDNTLHDAFPRTCLAPSHSTGPIGAGHRR